MSDVSQLPATPTSTPSTRANKSAHQQAQGRGRRADPQLPVATVAAELAQLLPQRACKGELRGREPISNRCASQISALGPAAAPRGPDAPVTIVEFSDFQCPYCQRLAPTMDQVKSNYGDKVRLVFRQFPLPFHDDAQKAAEASLCAEDEGKFWQMHDAMFEDIRALGVAELKKTAGELELNQESFDECLDSGKYAAQVAQDTREGRAAGVSGTPAMFINGRFVSGAVSYDQLAN